MSQTEKAKIDSLEQELHVEIRRSFSHESFHDLPDVELTITGLSCSADSMIYIANSVFRTYLPSLDYKGIYQSVIVNMESGREERIGAGSRQIFTFRLDQ